MMILKISAFGPSITEQCAAAGVVATGKPLELIERLSRAITLCHIQGVLTDSECDKARVRLIKAARFRPDAPQTIHRCWRGVMGFLNSLANVAKAGIAVAVSPVALVADIVTLPASACDNKGPFDRTGKMLSAAGKCITEATKPSKEPTND